MVDIGLDLQRAYDDGYKQGEEAERAWWIAKAIEMTLDNCRSRNNGCKNCTIECMWREE